MDGRLRPTATIAAVHAVPARGAFFFDDQAAIRAGAAHDGFDYVGAPLTAGYRRIRQPAEAVSILVVLDDGVVAHGDCVAVQYTGAGGRETLFRAADAVALIEEFVRPLLLGAALDSFRELAGRVEALRVDGCALPAAVRYGVTQALLDAVALAQRRTMAEVVRDEYDTGCDLAPVAMFAQCGDERYAAVDKMILKEVDVLPHGLVNNVAEKVGSHGEIFLEYVRWVRDRVLALRERSAYAPRLHFDTYGTLGAAFGDDVAALVGYFADLAAAAAPFALQIEHPLDAGGREAQIAAMAELRGALARAGVDVRIVADEWCNTLEDIEAFVDGEAADVIHVKLPDLGGLNNAIEALVMVRSHGLVAYCGGSCTETERSAQVSAHVAMACGAGQVLAKPGMGVDEGLEIVGNEMARVLALRQPI